MDTSKPITIQQLMDASDADLATLTTRHLFSIYRGLQQADAYNGHYGHDDYDWNNDKHGPETQKTHSLMDRLKAILDTRPHVPNKKEGKALRREAAKRGR